jgi:dienelactone hydrolase
MKKNASKPAPVAAELAAHGYAITRPVPGSDVPADYTFVLTRDEIYVPIALRRPPGEGPYPAIVMGRGAGRGGVPHLEQQVARLSAMQDRLIARGYVVAYANYRNEVPHLYGKIERAHNLPDDMSGGENRTLKSSPTLDSDDLVAILRYLETLPYVDAKRIGVMGVSHSGEMILKVAAETTFAAGIVIEGASHEFLAVDTGPKAPRKDNELQYQDIEVVRRNADKATAMSRIARIATPMLHVGRDRDHLQGIFRLAHEWMAEAGKDTQWVTFDHPEHGYPFVYNQPDGSYRPDPVQAEALDVVMDYLDARLKA